MIEQLLRAENALALGLLDQAEQIYGQTLAHDPANSIALVGLARVALERGDEPASLGFARRALSIDPENTQALRMIARLEEVIRERGDVIPKGIPPAPERSPGVPESPAAAALPPTIPTSPPAAASEVAPKRPGLLRRLTGRL